MKSMFRWTFIAILCTALIGGLGLATPSHGKAYGISWIVSVFNNRDLAGTPVWSGTSPTASYTWGQGAPTINGQVTGAPVDNFSVRFQTSVFFTAGTYRFTVQVDDGARLYIDGFLLINDWQSNALHTIEADFNFAMDGTHTIVVEMFDSVGDATIIVTWALSPGPLPTATTGFVGAPWYAEFFDGLDLAGTPLFTSSYPPSGLNLNWGEGSPGGTVPVDNFSARFTRTLNVPTDLPKGSYTFYARADDSFRFQIDQTVIFDYWDVFAGDQNVTAEVTLLDGPHDLRFEYRERTVNAYLFLTWTPPNAQDPILNPDGGGPPGPGPGPAPGPSPAPAVTATVAVPVLNFRAAPDPGAAVLAQLASGQTYPVTGKSWDSAWLQITVNGQSGWVMAQYVTITGDISTVPVVDGGGGPAPAPQPTGVRGQVLGNLIIRDAPGVRANQIGMMPWGVEVDILGRDSGHTWYQVNYNGVVGWSFAPWIKLTVGTFDSLPYTDGSRPVWATPPTTGVIAQAYGNMRIRSGPGLQYPKISKAQWGTRVEVLALSTDGWWLKVRHGDVIGWTYRTWYEIVQGSLNTVPVSDQ
ncbi:MAG: SH3 domain-containing protein [Anaerolineae bacterium]|nr:SH3 domain-containing protein [Anaerolineae bacterium]